MDLPLDNDSVLYADAAFNDYAFEQLLKEAEGVLLIPDRRRNMRRQWSGPTRYVQKLRRKRIETAISSIHRLLLKEDYSSNLAGLSPENSQLYSGLRS